MKRILGAVAGFALATAVAAAPAEAQRRTGTGGARATGAPRFGIAGGIAQPSGDLGDAAELGFNISGTVDFRPLGFPFPLQGAVMFNRFALDEDETGEGSSNIIAGTINGVADIPTQSPAFRPFLIGGAGLYRTAYSIEDGEDDDGINFGINFGGGLRFPLGQLDTYVEVRYHNIFGEPFEDVDASVIPIVFGIRF